MLSPKILFDKKSPYVFLIKFLLCFFLLYLFFPLYWAVTGPGGTVYSPFLDNHLNIIRGLTRFLTGASRFFLEAFHYPVYQKDYHSLQIGSLGSVNINPSCLGWGVMSFWVAFVFANNGSAAHKLSWIFGGISFICLLNIARIIFITLAIHLQWKNVFYFDHHKTFNILSYGCIFMLMFWYIKVQKNYEEGKFVRKQQTNKMSIK